MGKIKISGNVGIGTTVPMGLLNVVGGNVGLGTWTAPANRLDVSGAQAVGAGYAGISAAPSNGLIVQGNVGVGSVTPGQALDETDGDSYPIAPC